MRGSRLPSLPLLFLPPPRPATALRSLTRRRRTTPCISFSFFSSAAAASSNPNPPPPPSSSTSPSAPPKRRGRRRRGQQPEYDGGPLNEALVASLPGGWADVREEIKKHAETLGFARARVTTPEPSSRFDQYKAWVAEGQHGEMGYLAREDRLARRADLDLILPGVHAVICTMTLYWPGKKGFPPASAMHALPSLPSSSSSSSSSSSRSKPPPPPSSSLKRKGVISCYSWGEDYHNLITPRLQALAEWTHTRFGGQGRWYVDTGPLMERDLAERAGLGFIGKNTLMINEGLGSGTFLAELLTTLPLPQEEKRKKSGGCGTCRRCIVACPTGAISQDGYKIDARKCVSYLTIENKGGIPVELRPKMKNLIYGCDICQQVCPWNRWSWPENKPVRTLFTTTSSFPPSSSSSGSVATTTSSTSSSRPTSSFSSSSLSGSSSSSSLLTSSSSSSTGGSDTTTATAATTSASSSSLPPSSSASSPPPPPPPSPPPPSFPPLDVSTPGLASLLQSLKTEEGFKQRFTGSPIQRIGRARMLRNVAVAVGNSREEGGREEGREEEEEAEELLRVLKEVLEEEEDEMVREHLEWAIGRLECGGEGGREEGGVK